MEGELIIVVLGVVLVGLIAWRRAVYLRPLTGRVIEPLGFLYRDFSLARVVGDEDKTISALMSFARASSGAPTILDEIIEGVVTLPRRPSRPVSLLLEKPLAIIGRQRIFCRDKQTVSVLVGELEELKDQVPNLPEGWQQEARRAAGRGYLPLLVAVAEPGGKIHRALHATHQPLGLVLVEGDLDTARLKALNRWGEAAVRFLTFAPKELAQWLFVRVFPEADPLTMSSQQLKDVRPLRQRDDLAKNATIIAGAGLEERYRTVNVWRHRESLELYSRNPEDEELPIEPHTVLS